MTPRGRNPARPRSSEVVRDERSFRPAGTALGEERADTRKAYDYSSMSLEPRKTLIFRLLAAR